MVDSESVESYRPPLEFEEESKKALVDLNMTDSTELWLLKLPFSNVSLFLCINFHLFWIEFHLWYPMGKKSIAIIIIKERIAYYYHY